MRHVTFDPATLSGADRQWWDAWEKRAAAATVAVIDEWEGGKDIDWDTKSDVWKDLKTWLLPRVFDGKCAYCETRSPRFSSDAEHFRPKGRVDAWDAAAKKWRAAEVEWPEGKIETHPGYFWLAFHWKNLVPACEKCNSGAGKQNKFPLEPGGSHVLIPKLTAKEARAVAASARASTKWPGRYYLDFDDLDVRESRALLHPYFDNPRDHIRFGRGGIIAAVEGSLKGASSIETFKLDDPNLTVDRQQKQQDAEMAYRARLAQNILGRVNDPFNEAMGALQDFQLGKAPYSVAVLDYIELVRSTDLGVGKGDRR